MSAHVLTSLAVLDALARAYPDMTAADLVKAAYDSRGAYIALRQILDRWCREPNARPVAYSVEDQTVRELRVQARLWQGLLDDDAAAVVASLRGDHDA